MTDLVFPNTEVVGDAVKGWPCAGPISQRFGDLDMGYPHRGLDIVVPVGTPLFAPAGGSVQLHRPGDGWGDGSFGNCVVIDVPSTPWYVLLAHMSAFGVQNNQVVQAGEYLGLSGNTGTSTGPHVHVQVCRSSWFPTDISLSADPLQFLPKEEGMTPKQLELLLKLATIIVGTTDGKDFETVEAALAAVEPFADNDELLWKGMLNDRQRMAEHILHHPGPTK